MFLSPTCCGMWLFVGFSIDDTEGNAALIGQRSHIKSIFVNMIHYTSIFKYSRHIRIISCVGLEPFVIVINFDAMSFSNVFSSFIYVFRCKGITILNQ